MHQPHSASTWSRTLNPDDRGHRSGRGRTVAAPKSQQFCLRNRSPCWYWPVQGLQLQETSPTHHVNNPDQCRWYRWHKLDCGYAQVRIERIPSSGGHSMYSGIFASYTGYIGLHWFIYCSCKETINAFSLQSTSIWYRSTYPTAQARLLARKPYPNNSRHNNPTVCITSTYSIHTYSE